MKISLWLPNQLPVAGYQLPVKDGHIGALPSQEEYIAIGGLNSTTIEESLT